MKPWSPKMVVSLRGEYGCTAVRRWWWIYISDPRGPTNDIFNLQGEGGEEVRLSNQKGMIIRI